MQNKYKYWCKQKQPMNKGDKAAFTFYMFLRKITP